MTPSQEIFVFPEKKRNYKRKPLYTKEVLEPIVKQAHTITDVLRATGFCLTGNTHAWFTKKIKELQIDTSHFYTKRENYKSVRNSTKKDKSEYLRLFRIDERIPNAKVLRRSLTESGREYKCEVCGLLPEWEGEPLRIQVDHIDGNKLDNRTTNLRFICPNCHTQTPTFCSNNRIFQHARPRCSRCGKLISRKAKICKECRSSGPRERKPSPEKRKFKRPPMEELQSLIDTMPMTKIGKMFGVSDNSIRKWAKDYGIVLKKKVAKRPKPKGPKFVRKIIDGKIWCNVHKDMIPVEEFTKDKNDPLGLFSCCRECRKTQKGRKSRKLGESTDRVIGTDC